MQPRNQLCVVMSRHFVLQFSGSLSFRDVGVDNLLVREVECERAMHLLDGQCRVAINHAIDRHSLAEEIH